MYQRYHCGAQRLIQMKGVKVGLLCTAGHEDSIEIRLGHKEEGHRYDASYPPAPQIATRDCRLPIRGRILADGTEHEPLNEQDVLDAIEVLKKKKRTSSGHLFCVVYSQHPA